MSAIANHIAVDGLIIFGARFTESWFQGTTLAEANHLPVFIAHGETDEAISIAVGERARDALTGLGYDVTFRPFPEGHSIPAEVLAEVVAWIES
jgi:predicted esterase